MFSIMLNRWKLIKYMGLFVTAAVFLIIAYNLPRTKQVNDGNSRTGLNNGEFIVIFDADAKEDALPSMISCYPSPVRIVRRIDNYALLYVEDPAYRLQFFKDLEDNPEIKAVQTNGRVDIQKISNDTYSDTQWAIHNPGYYSLLSDKGPIKLLSTSDIDMDVPEAWDYIDTEEVDRREVVVAIIDTGVDYNHPDLAEHMWMNKNEVPDDGVDNDGNGYIDDINGWDFYNNDATVCHYKYDKAKGMNLSLPEDNDDHGTHIAGIIGAATDNGIGIAGTASKIDIKLMALKINGGPEGTGNISNAIEAIKYATMMGADICNISWGTNQYSPALKEVIGESDMLFVAAAGNSGTDNNVSPVYPASFGLDNTISVTFIDADGRLTRLSNYGETTVDTAAPGNDILSTVVGTYVTMSGSSMAAPQVSAVAALLYSYHENLYPANIKRLILDHIKPLKSLDGYMLYPGIPSAFYSVMAADQMIRDTDPPIIDLDTIYNKGDFDIPVKAGDVGDSGIRVIRWLAGERTLSDFGRGMVGSVIEDNRITVSKAGKYTIYAGDYAGNDTIKVYEVKDDKSSPKITVSYIVSDDYRARTVNVRIIDGQSGVKRVKYLEGQKEASDFLPAGSGKEIELTEHKGSFTVKKDGTYSIYAIDNRGNQTVRQISIKTVRAEDVKFTRNKKAMEVGEEYSLRAYTRPVNTTDRLTYKSSDESIATVNGTGRVTALNEGKAVITVTTSSGRRASCEITVLPKQQAEPLPDIEVIKNIIIKIIDRRINDL